MSKKVNLFNRKELTVTNDLKRQAEIRELLSDNFIDYDLKVTNVGSASFMGPSRGRGVPGINQQTQYEYKFYVHKEDYEKAYYLLTHEKRFNN